MELLWVLWCLDTSIPTTPQRPDNTVSLKRLTLLSSRLLSDFRSRSDS